MFLDINILFLGLGSSNSSNSTVLVLHKETCGPNLLSELEAMERWEEDRYGVAYGEERSKMVEHCEKISHTENEI